MSRLGISVYPEHSTPEKDRAYIDLAAKHGFSRIFSCLLSVEGKKKEDVLEEFRDFIYYAHSKGMEVVLDVAPYVFERFDIPWNDLSFFEEMHADGIRLDEGFDGMKEAAMTYNPNGLKIEINASNLNKYLENIESYHPNNDNLITCHNFYPQRYTGLGLEHFKKCNANILPSGLPIAAFVSSNEPGTFGPWPVEEGLCTLEMHRGLPIDLQARHLIATGEVEDILVGNAYASEKELEELGKLDLHKLAFRPVLEKELSDVEKKIMYDFPHVARGDMSDYMARSTYPRIVYKNVSIPAENTRDLKRGDIVILNDGYGRYKGELHVVLKDMDNDGKKNVVAHLPEEELILLDYLEPNRAFAILPELK